MDTGGPGVTVKKKMKKKRKKKKENKAGPELVFTLLFTI